MKKTICVISCVLIFSMFYYPLFALIEGRVEGVVKDKDTKQLIEGATVTLKILSDSNLYELFESTYTTKKNGKFRFNIKPRKGVFYYIQCQKISYISLVPRYYFEYSKKESFRDMVKGFSVNEGQVKFIEIEMEKGGALEGVIYGVDWKGESPLSLVGGLLILKTNPNADFLCDASRYVIGHIETDKNGYFYIDGLETNDKYYLALQPVGHFVSDIKGASVIKGEKKRAEYRVDMTDQTGIEGYVKVEGQPMRACSVFLTQVNPSNPDLVIRQFYIKTGEDGFFFYRGMPTGTYWVSIRGFDINQKYYSRDKLEVVQVELNKVKKIILNL